MLWGLLLLVLSALFVFAPTGNLEAKYGHTRRDWLCVRLIILLFNYIGWGALFFFYTHPHFMNDWVCLACVVLFVVAFVAYWVVYPLWRDGKTR